MQFQCSHCSALLRVREGVQLPPSVKCPKCQSDFSPLPLPGEQNVPPPLPTQAPSSTIYCPKCGAPNSDNNFRCTDCGFALHDPGAAPRVVTDDSGMGGLIPLKNSAALAAYYLGVFSLIPCIGLPLGITALILGISGVKYANKNPEAKGKVHAWVGIILGGLCAFVYGVGLIFAVIAMMNAGKR
jgi:hypothetical protein